MHFDRAIELCESEDTTQLTQFVTEDPPAFVRLFSALNWWLLGEDERAEEDSELAFRIASRDGTHTWATMISQWSASTLAMFRRDTAATLERCTYGIGLCEAGGYGLGIPYMNVCQGWAMAVDGDVDGGTAKLLHGMAVAEAFGAVYMRPGFAAIHAEVCSLGGRYDEALAAVARGFAAADAKGERWYDAELHRMRATALLGSGDAVRARAPSSNEPARSHRRKALSPSPVAPRQTSPPSRTTREAAPGRGTGRRGGWDRWVIGCGSIGDDRPQHVELGGPAGGQHRRQRHRRWHRPP